MEIPEQIYIELESVGGMDALIRQLPPENELKAQSLIHKALSSPIRLTILNLLAVQPLCVCVIQEIVKTSPSRLSYHLSILSENQLVESKRAASWLIYSITELGREYLLK